MKYLLEILIVGYIFINIWLYSELKFNGLKNVWVPFLSVIFIVVEFIQFVKWLVGGLVKSY